MRRESVSVSDSGSVRRRSTSAGKAPHYDAASASSWMHHLLDECLLFSSIHHLLYCTYVRKPKRKSGIISNCLIPGVFFFSGFFSGVFL